MHEGLADTPHARLWHWDTGGTGDTIILCHPASQGCAIWEHQRDSFSAAGFRVVAYARRGYDQSETGTPDTGTAIEDLSNLMDWLKIERAHLLGAAAGGITVTGFAVAHPARTTSAVLAGTIISPDEDEWRKIYGRLGIAAVRDTVSVDFLELGPAFRAANPEGTKRFITLSSEAKPDTLVNQALGVTVNWQALENLQVPVLLITGEADLYAPPPLHELIASHLPNPQMKTMRAIGHAPYWEAPNSFDDIVLDFLKKRASRLEK